MSLNFVLFLWVITLVAFLMSRTHIWKKYMIFSMIPMKSESIPLLKKLGNIKYLSQPGYIVKRFITEEKYKIKLKEAGGELNFSEFQTIKQLIVYIGSIFFLIFIFFVDWYTAEGIKFFDFILFIGLLLLLFFIPDLLIQIQKEKRQKQLSDDIPYFVDILAITLDSGMNLERALSYVAEHMNGKLANEIQKKLKYFNMGISLEKVLDELYYHIPVAEFQRFISSMKQAKKLGVSLSQTLLIQSQLIQSIKIQKAEEMSRTASVKISIPLVLFIFPALLIIYIGPALIQFMQ